MNLDFVKTPFTNNPSMVRYEGNPFNKNPNQYYIKQKKKELKHNKEKLIGESKLSMDIELRKLVTTYIKGEKSLTLEELTLAVEEDFAVMHKGKMELASVCFPSGWIPSNKLGKHLSNIHKPVADNRGRFNRHACADMVIGDCGKNCRKTKTSHREPREEI